VAVTPEPAVPEPDQEPSPLIPVRPAEPLPALADDPLPIISGPVYRAVLDERAPVPPTPAESTSDQVVVPVPDELTVLFRQELDVDVAPIPVHRGRAVTQQAVALGARAFTHAGEVFLPDRAGPLTERPARALLAHELAHAVQQRVLGTAQPSPDSADGRELEDAAHAVEQWVAGDGAAPPSLVHRTAGPVMSMPTFLPANVTQLAEGTVVAEELTSPSPVPTSWTLRDGFTAETPPAPDPQVPAVPDAVPDLPPDTGTGGSSSPVFPWIAPQAPEPDRELGQAMASAFQQIADLRESVAGLRASQERPEQPRFVDLSEVAGRIYDYVRSRLRAELIVDRERAGVLADIG
jgi:hypothetical protein